MAKARVSPRKPHQKPKPKQVSLDRAYREAPIGLCHFDTELRYVWINEWLAALNGIPVEEHLGCTIEELLPDLAAHVVWQLRRVLETGQPILGGIVKAETEAHPGEKRYYEHNYYAIRSDDGRITGVSCAVQDITERKRAESERLEKALANYRKNAEWLIPN